MLGNEKQCDLTAPRRVAGRGDRQESKFVSFKRLLLTLVIGSLGFVFVGCRPSVRDVVKVLQPVPLNSSREQLRKVFVEAYGKAYPNWESAYALVTPPRPVTKAMLRADKELIIVYEKAHSYVRVYPSNLYEKMPLGALTESIGLVAEAAHGEIPQQLDRNTSSKGYSSNCWMLATS